MVRGTTTLVRDMKGRNGRFTLLLHAMHAQHQKATPRAL
jgi:hypothetical protein